MRLNGDSEKIKLTSGIMIRRPVGPDQ